MTDKKLMSDRERIENLERIVVALITMLAWTLGSDTTAMLHNIMAGRRDGSQPSPAQGNDD